MPHQVNSILYIDLLKHTCGLIGDICRNNIEARQLLNSQQMAPLIECIISYGKRSSDSKSNAEYAKLVF